MSTPPGADLVVSEEQWRVGTEWVVSGRVRLRRRVVTEHRTVDVVVRREIVEFDGDTVDYRDGRLVGVGLDGPAVAAPAPTGPFVAVLREEIPVVTTQIRPYERVTVTTTHVQDAATVHDTVRREQVDLTLDTPFQQKEIQT